MDTGARAPWVEPILTVSGLGKRYRGDRVEGQRTWWAAEMGRRLTGRSTRTAPQWSLRDCSFEVKPGEIIGVIGSNGAGKTTLLRVLAGITEPTAGRAVLRGRMMCLLEAGAGFHPELSGRDNIALKAAAHGVGRAEVDRLFAAIVAFADLEAHLDTPLKRYSSGMRSRLGLAIGLALPHTLLGVDEALAVGDAELRERATHHIKAASSRGVATLFVSHDLAQVAALCPRSLYLKAGALVADGPTDAIIARYQADRGG